MIEPTGADTQYVPIMYLTKDISYLDKKYLIVAHIHGKTLTAANYNAPAPVWAWEYDAVNKPDKVEVYKETDPGGGMQPGQQWTYDPSGKGADGHKKNPTSTYGHG